MLADADGEIASLELSSTRTKLRTPGPHEDVLFHTNTFWTEEMRQVQVHDDAVYTRRAPAGLRGHLLHQSAIKRRERFEQLLASDQPLDLNALSRIMADHGEDGKPADTTPCVHGPYWSTTASLQLFPRTRRIRVAFDSACRGQHVELAL